MSIYFSKQENNKMREVLVTWWHVVIMLGVYLGWVALCYFTGVREWVKNSALVEYNTNFFAIFPQA